MNRLRTESRNGEQHHIASGLPIPSGNRRRVTHFSTEPSYLTPSVPKSAYTSSTPISGPIAMAYSSGSSSPPERRPELAAVSGMRQWLQKPNHHYPRPPPLCPPARDKAPGRLNFTGPKFQFDCSCLEGPRHIQPVPRTSCKCGAQLFGCALCRGGL